MTDPTEARAALHALKCLDDGMNTYGVPEKDRRDHYVRVIRTALTAQAKADTGDALRDAVVTFLKKGRLFRGDRVWEYQESDVNDLDAAVRAVTTRTETAHKYHEQGSTAPSCRSDGHPLTP